jgi:hypothetical protein
MMDQAVLKEIGDAYVSSCLAGPAPANTNTDHRPRGRRRAVLGLIPSRSRCDDDEAQKRKRE